MSVPNPCRSCGISLQHCLEMRQERTLHSCGAYCCAPCADGTSQHAGSPPETPGTHADGAFREVLEALPPDRRTTAELRLGDRVYLSGPEIRTVRACIGQDFNDWHRLYWFEPGGVQPLWSRATDTWELAPPPPPELREYAVRNANGEIFPMPSRAYAQHVAEGAPDLQAVSRPVPLWEVLRPAPNPHDGAPDDMYGEGTDVSG